MPNPASCLPNLVIGGVTKAGTTSLFHYLGQHPDVGAADTKEVDHYAPLLRGEPTPTLEQYAAHFRGCGDRAVRVEASPRYFTGGAPLVQRLVADLTVDGRRPRVLLALREPVDRMWSSYTFKRSRGRLPPGVDFAEFVARCRTVHDEGLLGDPDHEMYRTLAVGVYADFVPAWVDGLGADLRIVFSDDLRAPAEELRGLCGWLGLDPAPVDGFDLGARNPTVQPRHQSVRRAAVRLNQRLDGVVRDGSVVDRTLRAAYRALNSARLAEEMSPADRAVLEDFYAPSLVRLRSVLLGHGTTRLPAWLAG